MTKDDEQMPAIVPSWMGQSTLVGPFRTPRSFTLISAHHLLAKLRWDTEQLDAMQWDENLGKLWRQAVSYKAIDCATSILHLDEWFVRDLRGIKPRQRACAFLEIEEHDLNRQIPLEQFRQKALAKCQDLDICRVIAIASKHYDVGRKSRPEIRTACVLAIARRNAEPFQRPYMQLSVFENDKRRDMRKILTNCQQFWEQLLEAAMPQ
jgi:hypothetical protein